MRNKALIIPALAVTALMVGSAAPATADIVGEPGTPNCFGQRVSHGSSSHDLTPKERAAGLQEFVDAGDPLAVALFGETVSVGEFADFVRVNCSDNPYIP